MNEKNVAITNEEARDLLKKPETNEIHVEFDTKVKLLLLHIKNHLVYFEEVIVTAIGKSIGKALSAAQLLKKEDSVKIKKVETDLIGEEKKYQPSIEVVLTRFK